MQQTSATLKSSALEELMHFNRDDLGANDWNYLYFAHIAKLKWLFDESTFNGMRSDFSAQIINGPQNAANM